MKTDRVSVLVTFYNQEKYVDQALGSIVKQKTDFGVKIIVGDDGSTDNTQYNIKEWIKKYPDTIEMHVMDRKPGEHIAGFRASRNRLNLLKYVNTEYFIFLDGDDYYEYDKKLQRQVDVLDNPQNNDCIACGHNTEMLFPNGRKTAITSTKLKEGKYHAKKYWKELYVHTDTLLTRSSIIPSVNLKLLQNNFNDNLITFVVIQEGKIYYIPELWTVYVQTGDGIWTSGKQVVNLIRNMFLYDLSNRINPSMKKETDHRFVYTWLSLLKIRKQIKSDELKQFSLEAKRRRLSDSYSWIHYNELKLVKRIVLCLKAFSKCWKTVLSGSVIGAINNIKKL